MFTYSRLAHSRRVSTSRFNVTKVLIVYIQPRGRATKTNSKYIVMFNTRKTKKVRPMEEVKTGEIKKKRCCTLLPEEGNLATTFLTETPQHIQPNIDDMYLRGVYTIPSIDVPITLSNSISLLSYYCACLRSGSFCNFEPIYEVKTITRLELFQKYIHLIGTARHATQEEFFYCKLTLSINGCPTNVEGVAHTEDEVKAVVSMKACIALHKSGDMDDHLVVKYMTEKNALENNGEFDENGEQVGTCGNKRFYNKATPSFWLNMQQNRPALVDETSLSSKVERGPFWISVFDIDTDHLEFRPMILITRKPLPPMPEIALFNHDNAFKVHVRSKSTPFSFENDHHLPLLADYAFAWMRCITNKEFQCQNINDMAYFLAPLVRGTDITNLSSLQEKIDWNEVVKSICDNITTHMSIDDDEDLEAGSEDAIVIDSSDLRKRMYIVEHIQYNMNPLSKVMVPFDNVNKPIREQGYESFATYYQNQSCIKNTITDMHQPLLRVTQLKNNSFSVTPVQPVLKKEYESDSAVYWLVPELCQIYPVAASVYQTLHAIPTIMTRIDATLLLLDAKKSMGLIGINPDFMFEAYTTASAGMEVDYERLEFLGDSVLKFITSAQVFVNYPISQEGELTEVRMNMINNKTLFESAKKLKLYQYICSQSIPRRLWRPPNFISSADSPAITKTLTKHQLSEKTLADVIESTLGAAYYSAGMVAALHTARQLHVPLNEEVRQMEDFYPVYQYQKQLHSISSQYDPSLQEIDMQRVLEILGYEFRDPSLVVEALTHSSYLHSSVPCYERLEFLGDAVLDFCATNHLYRKYETAQPRTLHDLRVSSVNNRILAVLCVQLELHKHIRHPDSYLTSAVDEFVNLVARTEDGGRDHGEYWLDFNPPKILSDVMESLIGAVYVDSMFDLREMELLFDRLLRPFLDEHISIETIERHPIEKFQSIIQECGCFNYQIRNITQQSTSQRSAVFIHDTPFSIGSGLNMREAKRQAATRACLKLEDEPELLRSMCNCRAN